MVLWLDLSNEKSQQDNPDFHHRNDHHHRHLQPLKSQSDLEALQSLKQDRTFLVQDQDQDRDRDCERQRQRQDEQGYMLHDHAVSTGNGEVNGTGSSRNSNKNKNDDDNDIVNGHDDGDDRKEWHAENGIGNDTGDDVNAGDGTGEGDSCVDESRRDEQSTASVEMARMTMRNHNMNSFSTALGCYP